MNKKPWAIVALVSMGLLASFCICLGLFMLWGTNQPAIRHFENDDFSFDYPGGWRTFSEIWSSYEPGYDEALDANELTGVALPGLSRSVRIESREVPPGSSLKEVYEQTYQGTWIREYVKSNTVSEGTITVDGVKAYEKVYKRPHGEPWYQMRDVWLEKGGRIYILSCWATPNSFDEAQEDFNLIIDSFHVK